MAEDDFDLVPADGGDDDFVLEPVQRRSMARGAQGGGSALAQQASASRSLLADVPRTPESALARTARTMSDVDLALSGDPEMRQFEVLSTEEGREGFTKAAKRLPGNIKTTIGSQLTEMGSGVEEYLGDKLAEAEQRKADEAFEAIGKPVSLLDTMTWRSDTELQRMAKQHLRSVRSNLEASDVAAGRAQAAREGGAEAVPWDAGPIEQAVQSGASSAAIATPAILLGGPVGGSTLMGVGTAAQRRSELLAQGVPEAEANKSAAFMGSLEALTEFIPAHALVKRFPGFSQHVAEFMLSELPGENVNSVAQLVDDYRLGLRDDVTMDDVLTTVRDTSLATAAGGAIQVGAAHTMQKMVDGANALAAKRAGAPPSVASPGGPPGADSAPAIPSVVSGEDSPHGSKKKPRVEPSLGDISVPRETGNEPDLGIIPPAESGTGAPVEERAQPAEATGKPPVGKVGTTRGPAESGTATNGTEWEELQAVKDGRATAEQVARLEGQGYVIRSETNVPRLLPAGRRRMVELQESNTGKTEIDASNSAKPPEEAPALPEVADIQKKAPAESPHAAPKAAQSGPTPPRTSRPRLSPEERQAAGRAAIEATEAFGRDLESARAATHAEPTMAQAKAGNYAKGTLKFAGMTVALENPAGSTRHGYDQEGNKTWSRKMENDYGYVKGTEGNDGDEVDVFLAGAPDTGKVFVINQVNPETRAFDEHKAVLGAHTRQEAEKIYRAHYPKTWKGLGSLTELPTQDFRKWLQSGNTKRPLDRRGDRSKRQRVAEMSPEALRGALLTHELTGIPNRRAYEESARKATQVSVDVDSLKWVNDNMGHESGNELLKAVATALKDETSHAFHISGDEFVVEADHPEAAHAVMKKITDRLKGATIEIEMPDGSTRSIKGLGVSYGLGGSLDEADVQLQAHKTEREAKGQRAGRGQQPPGAAQRAAETGRQDQAGAAAEKVAQPRFARRKGGTAAFDTWFQGSKVVNEDGSPKVVYHGTGKDISEFQPEDGGIFFASTQALANEYAFAKGTRDVQQPRRFLRGARMAQEPTGANVIPVYLSLKNPLVIDAGGAEHFALKYEGVPHSTRSLAKIANESGHDGLIVRNVADLPSRSLRTEHIYSDVLVVFRPDQVKSAIGNAGAYSTTNPDIRFSRRPTFYSNVIRTTEALKQNKASGEQWWNTISKAPGVKIEELEWMGLKEWLDSAGTMHPIRKADLLDFMQKSQIQVTETVKGAGEDQTTSDERQQEITRLAEEIRATGARVHFLPDALESIEEVVIDGVAYGAYPSDAHGPVQLGLEAIPDEAIREKALRILSLGEQMQLTDEQREQLQQGARYEEYTLEGGDNYRELLLTLPSRSSPEQIAPSYYSSHFSEENVLAHVRLMDRLDTEGKRMLFVEEVQSDWHQAGRKDGYMKSVEDRWNAAEKTILPDGRVHVRAGVFSQTLRDIDEARDWFNANKPAIGVPDAPFKTTWPELAMKRVIRWAAENGYERVGWTTGQQQVERYSLAQHFDQAQWGVADGTQGADIAVVLRGAAAGGHRAITLFVTRENGLVRNAPGMPAAVGSTLAMLIGAETAQQILATKKGVLAIDADIGGEGQREFYDNILPRTVGRYIKKWGGEIQHGAFFGDREKGWINGHAVMADLGVPNREIEARWQALNQSARNALIRAYRAKQFTYKIHAFDVTPQMRAAAMEGQPLFARRTTPIEQWELKQFADSVKTSLGLEEFDLRARKNGDIHLELIMVPRGGLGLGTGTAAMERLTQFADSRNARLVLSPAGKEKQADWGTTSKARLERFYRRFGFVSNTGWNKDFTISDSMYREPNEAKYSRTTAGNALVDQLNPGGKRLSESQRPVIHAADIEDMAPPTAKPFLRLSGVVYSEDRATGSMYAAIDGKTVGYISPTSDGGTDLSVAEEFQRRGIGTELLASYLAKHPDMKAGGLTEAGESAVRAVAERKVPRSRRTADTGRGMPAHEVRASVQRALAGASLARVPPVQVVQTYRELPEAVRKQLEREGATQSTGAVFLPGIHGDRVVLIAENNATEDEVHENVYHELVGHYGLTQVMDGEGYNEVMDGIWRDMPERVRESARRNGLDVKDTQQRRIAAEEVIAYAAGNIMTGKPIEGAVTGWWKKTLEAIRAFFQRLFGQKRMNDVAIARIVANSKKALEGQAAGVHKSIREGALRHQRPPLYYSQLFATVNDSKVPNVAPPGEYAKIIQSQVGKSIKPDEMEWSGVTAYLESLSWGGMLLDRRGDLSNTSIPENLREKVEKFAAIQRWIEQYRDTYINLPNVDHAAKAEIALTDAKALGITPRAQNATTFESVWAQMHDAADALRGSEELRAAPRRIPKSVVLDYISREQIVLDVQAVGGLDSQDFALAIAAIDVAMGEFAAWAEGDENYQVVTEPTIDNKVFTYRGLEVEVTDIGTNGDWNQSADGGWINADVTMLDGTVIKAGAWVEGYKRGGHRIEVYRRADWSGDEDLSDEEANAVTEALAEITVTAATDIFQELKDTSDSFDSELVNAKAYLLNGNVKAAKESLETAAQMEREYGDDPLTSPILGLLKDNDGTKYSDYTVPGGKDYGERLFIWQNPKQGFSYTHSHWEGEENVLLHMRYDTRTGPKGEKILFLDEVQSDWHQAVRDTNNGPGLEQQLIDSGEDLRNEYHNRWLAPHAISADFEEGPTAQQLIQRWLAKLPISPVQFRKLLLGEKSHSTEPVYNYAYGWLASQTKASQYELRGPPQLNPTSQNPEMLDPLELLPDEAFDWEAFVAFLQSRDRVHEQNMMEPAEMDQRQAQNMARFMNMESSAGGGAAPNYIGALPPSLRMASNLIEHMDDALPVFWEHDTPPGQFFTEMWPQLTPDMAGDEEGRKALESIAPYQQAFLKFMKASRPLERQTIAEHSEILRAFEAATGKPYHEAQTLIERALGTFGRTAKIPRISAETYKIVKDGVFELFERAEKLYSLHVALSGASNASLRVPPLAKTWPLAGLKWALRHGAENGFDQIALAPGSVHGARWGATQSYDEAKLVETTAGARVSYPEVTIIDPSLKGAAPAAPAVEVRLRLPRQATASDPVMVVVTTRDRLAGWVGKDAAVALTEKGRVSSSEATIWGPNSDARLRGNADRVRDIHHGSMEIYNSILPFMFNKFLGKYGAKIRPGLMEGPRSSPAADVGLVTGETIESGKPGEFFPTVHVPVIDLNDKLKDAALNRGFPLFARRWTHGTRALGNAVIQGSNQFISPLPSLSSRVWNYLVYHAQDKFIDLFRTQKAVAKWRGTAGIPDNLDTYMRQTLYHGRVEQQTEEFEKGYVEPLVKMIKASGYDWSEVEDYLYARHAPEANARIASINPGQPQYNSGMTDQDAQAAMAAYAITPNFPQLEAIGRHVDTMTKFSRDMMVMEGLEDPAVIQAWEATYQHYVPLKGWAGLDLETDMPKRGRGFDVGGKLTKMRTGRTSRAATILANVVAQAQSTIILAEKAKVGRALYDFVRTTPAPDLWVVDQVEYLRYVDPSSGLVRSGVNPSFKLADNILRVRQNGVDYHITFNPEDEQMVRLAAAMKNLGADKIGPILTLLHGVNRTLSTLNTSLNPEFVVTNALRDLTTALANLTEQQQKGLRRAVVRDWRKAWWGIRQGQHGKNAAWAGEWLDFKRAGGKVGWIDHYKSPQDLEKKLRKHLTKDNVLTYTVKGVKAVGEFIENENAAVENAIRLSTFVNLKKAGISRDRAAEAAKNLTVNFNQKGALGTMMNSLYLFYNASIQGTARLWRLGQHPKGRIVMAGFVVAGIIQSILMRAIGGDDDDKEKLYDKVPEHDKEKNIIVMIPPHLRSATSSGEKPYIKIMLPYGFNTLFYTGTKVGDYFDYGFLGNVRRVEPGTDAGRIAGAFLGAFSPIGDAEGGLSQFLLPTLADPFVQLADNKSWWGGKIMPEDFDEEAPSPDSQKFFQSVPTAYKDFAAWLNEQTGGTEVSPGAIDVSPETFQHWADFTMGGAGRFGQAVINAPYKAIAHPEDLTTQEIPFWRKVIGGIGDRATQDAFFTHINELKYVKRELDAVYKLGPVTPEGQERMAYIANRYPVATKMVRSAYPNFAESRGIEDLDKDRILRGVRALTPGSLSNEPRARVGQRKAITTVLSDARKEIRRLEARTGLPAKERTEKIQVQKQLIHDTLLEFNKQWNEVEDGTFGERNQGKLIEKLGPLISGKKRREQVRALRESGYAETADLLAGMPPIPDRFAREFFTTEAARETET